MRKAFMMIELLLVFTGLILLINLSYLILSQENEDDYQFISITKDCGTVCAIEKLIP